MGIVEADGFLLISSKGTYGTADLNFTTELVYKKDSRMCRRGLRTLVVLAVMLAPSAGLSQKLTDARETIAAWEEMWNTYDLNEVPRVFMADSSVTYFSSERPGLIIGIEALRKHHEGFGFVPGGKKAEARLWLSEVRHQTEGASTLVTAIWHFVRSKSATEQKGPVTFVLINSGSGWRIRHAHFASE